MELGPRRTGALWSLLPYGPEATALQSPDVPEGAIKSKSVLCQPVGAMRQLQSQLRQSLRFETFASLLACDPEDEDDSVPHIRVRAKRGNTT